jgi:hypothetical protein
MLTGRSGFDIRREDFPTGSGPRKPRDVNSKFSRKPTRFRGDLQRLFRATGGWFVNRGGHSVDNDVHLAAGLAHRIVIGNGFSGL